MTYNIHHAQGTDDVLDLERIARTIEDQRVDAVALNEVDRHWSERSNWLDEPRWFAERLDLHVAFAANLDLDPLEPDQPRRQYGTAILSRWPIRSQHNTLLPKADGTEQRGLLQTTLLVRGRVVRFATSHLALTQAERQAQTARIVELLGSSPRAQILCGDFNATPDKPEIATLTGVFVDSWAKVGSGDGFTFSSEDPHERIDYIVASSDLTPVRARVLYDLTGSDHCPYVADYRLAA